MTITWFSATYRSWTILRRVSSLAILLLTLAAAGRGASSCDLNLDGQLNVVDVQMSVNQSLGIETCSSADVNSDDSCNVVDVQLVINAALGSDCPSQIIESPTPSQPWLTDFTPQRIHYVDDIACGGNGTIGNPECMATAMNNSHYACGDLHIFRAGTYDWPSILGIGPGAYYQLTKDCTQSNPAVWKGYVDANGQPENARWRRQNLQILGAWHWFVGLHSTEEGTSNAAGEFTFNSQAAGTRIINNVIHDVIRSPIARFGATPDGPGWVAYGNVLYKPGCFYPTPNLPTNTYVQNDFSLHGFKYYVQNMSLETIRASNCGRTLFQAYAASSPTQPPISGFHLQDNLFGDAPNSGTIDFGQDDNLPSSDNVIFRNYFVDFYSYFGEIDEGLRLGRNNPFVGTITENYFARANPTLLGYWGATDSHAAFVFEDNEIYDPPGGDHIAKFQTRATSGSVGSHKIPNQDVWNNNVYGGTFKAHLQCNGTNYGTNLTLAQWRTYTNLCRVTPGGRGFDLNSTNPPNPTTNKVVVLKNEYQCASGCPFTDQARGNIYVVNWAATSSQTVNIAGVVGPGKHYVVRYARDFFGTPAASGICPGSGACNVNLPTRRSSSESAGRFTNAYVITGQP